MVSAGLRLLGLALLPAALLAGSPEEAELESMTVVARPFSALDPGLRQVAQALAGVPGGTNLALPGQGARLSSLQDALEYQPGVLLQAFSGGNDQPRLNIRGSGIQGNPVSRGLLLRRDGLPLNEADGSFIIGLLDPRDSWAIITHRGANSRALGPASLGGDMNFLTPSRRDGRAQIRLEKGHYGRLGGHLALAAQAGQWDLRLAGSGDDYAGYRHHSESRRRGLSAQLGWRASTVLESRLSVRHTDLFFAMPFALTQRRAEQSPREVIGDRDPLWPAPSAALADPERLPSADGGVVGPQELAQETLLNVYRRDPRRQTRQWRVASRTQWQQPDQRWSLGVYLQDTDDLLVDPLSHALSGLRSQGAQWLWSGRGGAWQYQVGVDGARSSIQRAYFENAKGQAGRQYAELDLLAEHLLLDLQLGWQSGTGLALSSQWQWSTLRRDAVNRSDAQALEQRWHYLLPKFGLVYQGPGRQRWFANLSASTEAPSFWEIAANRTDPTPGSSSAVKLNALALQRGHSLEAGGAGQWSAALHWQLSVYRTELRDELLSTAGSSGIVDDTVNYAGHTRHQGVELGLDGVWGKEQRGLDYRLAWTFSDFRFRDGEHAGKRLAGVPRHQLQARCLLRLGDWLFGPTARWSPGRNPVDHSNTLFQESYALWGLELDYRAIAGWRVFLRAENLADRVYAASYVVRSEADPALPTYFPGNGRSLSSGFSYQF